MGPGGSTIARIHALADDLRAVQRASKAAGEAGGTTVRLREMGADDVDRAFQVLRGGPFSWVDDQACAARGVFGAHLLNRTFHASPTGLGDAAAAAVAVQRGGWIRRLSGGWQYHAAPMMRQRGATEPRVLDPLLFDRPVALSTWRRRVGARSATETWSPVQTSGFDFPPPLRLRVRSRPAIGVLERFLVEAARGRG